MRKRIGIYSATEEARQLIPSLLENPEFEIAAIVDPDAESIRQQLGAIDPGVARMLEERMTTDLDALLLDPNLHAVIDASSSGDFAANHPTLTERGIQVVTPLTARLLWCFSPTSRNNKSDLRRADTFNGLDQPIGGVTRFDAIGRRLVHITLRVGLRHRG